MFSPILSVPQHRHNIVSYAKPHYVLTQILREFTSVSAAYFIAFALLIRVVFVLVVRTMDSLVRCNPTSFFVCLTCTFDIAFNIFFPIISWLCIFGVRHSDLHTFGARWQQRQHITSEFNKRSLHNTTKCIKSTLLPADRRQKSHRIRAPTTTHTGALALTAQFSSQRHLERWNMSNVEKSLKYVKSQVSIIRFRTGQSASCLLFTAHFH